MDITNGLYKLFSFDISNPISFNSGSFLLLFAVFITSYAFLYKNITARKFLIIAFSLFFYYKLTGWYLLVMLLIATIDFFIAKLIFKSTNKNKKFLFLLFSICASLGLLIYFKYTNFFIESYCSISGGIFSALKIIVPLGISFYTFRTISYVLDVYREDMQPTSDFFEYIAYMTFFPLLIAGPITRAKQFLPQLKKHLTINGEKVNKAIFLIILGLVKKAVIADYIGQYCNLVFDAPGGYSGFENMIAVYGFALQIYFDFSGYTDMAIGISKLMGFDIGINFNKPYHALNVTDFWRRWHISLSSWLRDYLFTPIVFRLRNFGKIGIMFSLLLTFIICGFWHGANLTFIIWGALFGAAMSYEVMTAKIRKNLKKKINTHVYTFISWLFTFHFVTFLWIFFRAKNMQSVGKIFNQIFANMDWTYLSPFISARKLLVEILLLGFAFYALPAKWYPNITQRFIKLPYWVKLIIFIAIIQLVIQFQSEDVQPFIYAQF